MCQSLRFMVLFAASALTLNPWKADWGLFLWFWCFYHLCRLFSSLKSVRDGTMPNQKTSLYFELWGADPCMNWLVQTKNNGGKQPNAVSKYYFQVPFHWAFSDDRVHWQENCYCNNHYSHLLPIRMWVTGRSNCPQSQCSWALKVKLKGQQPGVRTMAKVQPFEMKNRGNSQEMAQRSFTIINTSHTLEREIRVTWQHETKFFSTAVLSETKTITSFVLKIPILTHA